MYNETYDNYIRSILGYTPVNAYEDNYIDYRNQNMNFNYNPSSNMDTNFMNNYMTNQMNNSMFNSMNSMSDMDLENCYPEIYKIVYPMICKKCDNARMPITKNDIENMTDEIYFALEERNDRSIENIKTSSVNRENSIKNTTTSTKSRENSIENRETRQINRNLRDLIQILLIRELLRRFRRPQRPGRPNSPMMRPGFGTSGTMINRNFETSDYDIFEY